MKKGKELAKNTFIFGVGIFGSKIIQFLLVPLYSIYLSTEEYSAADLLVSTITLISPLLTIAISSGLFRFVLGQQDNRKSALKLSCLICISATFIMFTLTPLWKRISFFDGYGWLLPLLFFTYTFKDLFAQFCKASGKNIIYALDGIISSLTLTLSSVLLISVFKFGANGYLFGVLISQSISICYFCLTCRIFSTLHNSKTDSELSKQMIRYSVPLIPNGLSWWIIQMSDRYMLVLLCGAAINGIYSMAYKIPSIFNLVVSIFIQAFGITAIKEIDSQDRVKDGRYDGASFNTIYELYLAVTYIAVVFVMLASKPIASIMLQKDFFIAWKYIPLLLCAYMIGNCQAFYGSLFSGIKKTSTVLISTTAGGVTNILLNLFLIPRYNAFGAAIATIIGYIVVYGVRVWSISRYIKMEHNLIKIIVSSTVIFCMAFAYIADSAAGYVISCLLAILVFIIFRVEIRKLVALILSFVAKLKTKIVK